MRDRSVFFVGACAAFAFVVGVAPARAVSTAFWRNEPISAAAIANDPVLATQQTWDPMVTTDGDWSRAGMRAILPAGEFYNHPLGGNTPASPAIVGVFPAVAYDTYVDSPRDILGRRSSSAVFPRRSRSASAAIRSPSRGATRSLTRPAPTKSGGSRSRQTCSRT